MQLVRVPLSVLPGRKNRGNREPAGQRRHEREKRPEHDYSIVLEHSGYLFAIRLFFCQQDRPESAFSIIRSGCGSIPQNGCRFTSTDKTLQFPSVCGKTNGNPKAQPSNRQEQAGSRRRFVFFILFNGFFGLQPIPVLCHEKDAGENEGDGDRFHQRE